MTNVNEIRKRNIGNGFGYLYYYVSITTGLSFTHTFRVWDGALTLPRVQVCKQRNLKDPQSSLVNDKSPERLVISFGAEHCSPDACFCAVCAFCIQITEL